MYREDRISSYKWKIKGIQHLPEKENVVSQNITIHKTNLVMNHENADMINLKPTFSNCAV